MKKMLIALLAVLGLGSTAEAGTRVVVGVGFGVWNAPCVVAPQPVYVVAPPVYSAPVIVTSPVYVAPAPVYYYTPSYYVPSPYVYRYYAPHCYSFHYYSGRIYRR